MSVSNTPHALTAIQAVETTSAILSFFGSSITIYKIISQSKQNVITNKMLVILLVIDFVLSIVYGVGIAGGNDHGFCQFQALIVQWFGLAAVLWVSVMSFHMYQWIVLKKNPDKISKKLSRNATIVVVLTGILGFSLLGAGTYGPAGVWCWVTESFQPLRFYCFYLILLCAWAFMIVMLYFVSTTLRSHVENDHYGMQSSEQLVQKKLALYVLVFVSIWFFGLLNRFVGWLYDDSIFWTTFLQAMFVPLQGFFNAVCFGNFIPWLQNMMRKFNPLLHNKRDSEDGFEMSICEVSVSPETSKTHYAPEYSPREVSIFMTTFNMGEASLESVSNDMIDWILRGHDIYVIGLQECLDVVGLRQMILDYIGGPSEFSMFGSEIGSGNTQLGYHGYIAITVYIRNTDLDQGNIRPTKSYMNTMATGTNLIVTTAQNKGGVGVAIQIHDTNFGFVACHLPSDSKGISKLSKRNASAQNILRKLNLSPENIEFDLHLQHDHMVVMGDLNYRMDTQGIGGGVPCLTGVSVACLIEKNSLGDDSGWLQRKYHLLRSISDPLYPSPEERRLLGRARMSARGAWTSVLRADELRMIVDDGDAFSGFLEPLPCFPPSYKRRKGPAGSCGDYTDPIRIVKGYSNTGEIDADIVMVKTISSNTNSSQNNTNSSSTAASIEGMKDEDDENDVENGDGQTQTTSSSKSESSDVGVEKSKPKAHRRLNAEVAKEDSSASSLPAKETDFRKIRPPSYTDRILFYSQDDRKERARVQAYDFCDTMRVSDHRPVSMTIVLEVNSAVKFHDNALDRRPRLREGVSSHMYELVLQDLSVTFGEVLEFVDDETEEEEGDEEMEDLDEGEPEADEDDYMNDEEEYDDEDMKEDENSTDAIEMSGKMNANATNVNGPSSSDSNNDSNMNKTDSSSKRDSSRRDSRRQSKKMKKSADPDLNLLLEEAMGDDELKKKWDDMDQEKGAWKKKVEEEELSRKLEKKKKATYSMKKKLKKLNLKKKSKKIDSIIDQVVAVFPLPTKDPLITQKNMHNILEAFESETTGVLGNLQKVADRYISGNNLSDSVTSPMVSDSATINTNEPLVEKYSFLHPFTTFPWKERKRVSSKTMEQQTVDMKLSGVVSPELGANVLLKFLNKSEYDLGECAICLSHLLSSDPSKVMKSSFKIPISSGGQLRGEASLSVSLRCLQVPEQSHHERASFASFFGGSKV